MSYDLKARPTAYRGIEMRSRLEAKYAQWLDTNGATWEYEPQCFANEDGQYLPDFLIRNVWVLVGYFDVYVEVKPLLSMFPAERLREVAGIIAASKPEAIVVRDAADQTTVGVCFAPWMRLRAASCYWTFTSADEMALAPKLRREWAE